MTMPSAPPAPTAEDALDRLSRTLHSERGALAALARQEGLTPEDALDCVEDALCTLLDRLQIEPLDSAAELGPLLATVVRNAARNQRRRHFRARPHVEVEAVELADEARASEEELVARAEETVRLRACVEQLCEIQRAVVTLRLLEERPGEDVAALLSVSKNHVAVLLHRAKAALRTCMLEGEAATSASP